VNLAYSKGENFNMMGTGETSSESTSPETLFYNLIWLTTKEAAVFLRRTVNAIYLLVSRKQLRARKFGNRLYFNKDELNYLIETSELKGGY
jgi:excisionase family DNA binding protein